MYTKPTSLGVDLSFFRKFIEATPELASIVSDALNFIPEVHVFVYTADILG